MQNSWAQLAEEIKQGNLNAAQWFAETVATDQLKIYQHQLSNLCQIANVSKGQGLLIADNVGLGKTVSALLGLIYHILFEKAKNILILTPPKLIKPKWERELRLFFEVPQSRFKEDPYHIPLYKIYQEREVNDLEFFSYQDDQAKILITSPYRLREHLDCETICSHNYRCIMTRAVLNAQMDFLVVDEAHQFGRRDKSTKNTLELRRSDFRSTSLSNTLREINKITKKKIFLTATPMGNSVLELFGLLDYVDKKYDQVINFCYKHSKARMLSHLDKSVDPMLLQSVSKMIGDLTTLLVTGGTTANLDKYIKLENQLLALIKLSPNSIPEKIRSIRYTKWGLLYEFFFKDSSFDREEILETIDLAFRYISKRRPEDKQSLKQRTEVLSLIYDGLNLTELFRRSVVRTLLEDVPSINRVERNIKLVLTNRDENPEGREIERVNIQLEEIIEESKQSSSNQMLAKIAVSINAKKRLASEVYSYWLTANRSSNKYTQAQLKALITAQQNLDEEEKFSAFGMIPQFNISIDSPDDFENLVLKFPDSRKYLEVKRIIEDYFANRNLPIIIFTEYEDTLTYIAVRIERDFDIRILRYSGNLYRTDEEFNFARLTERFEEEPHSVPKIIVSTDAGSTGIDLPFCGMVINYDIPWNPVKLIQRIGRLDRINRTDIIEAAVMKTSHLEPELRIGLDTKIQGFNMFNGMLGSADYRIVERQVRKIKQHWNSLGSIDTVLHTGEEDIDLSLYNSEALRQRSTDIGNLGKQGVIPTDFGIRSSLAKFNLRKEIILPKLSLETSTNVRLTNLSLGMLYSIHEEWPRVEIALKIHGPSNFSLDRLSQSLMIAYKNESPLFYHLRSLITTVLGLPSTEIEYSKNLPKFIRSQEMEGIRSYLKSLVDSRSILKKSEVQLIDSLLKYVNFTNLLPIKEGIILDMLQHQSQTPIIFLVKNQTSVKTMLELIEQSGSANTHVLSWNQYNPTFMSQIRYKLIIVGLPLLDYHYASKIINSSHLDIEAIFFDLETEIWFQWLKKYTSYVENVEIIKGKSYTVIHPNIDEYNTVGDSSQKELVDLLLRFDISKRFKATSTSENANHHSSVLVSFESGTSIILAKNSKVYKPFASDTAGIGSMIPIADCRPGDLISFTKRDARREIFEEILGYLYNRIPEIRYLSLLPSVINFYLSEQKQSLEQFRIRLNDEGMSIVHDETINKWITQETKFPVNRRQLVVSLIKVLKNDTWTNEAEKWLIAISKIQGIHTHLSRLINKMALKNYASFKNNFVEVAEDIPITYAELSSLVQIDRIQKISVIEGSQLLEGVYF